MQSICIIDIAVVFIWILEGEKKGRKLIIETIDWVVNGVDDLD